MKVLISHLTRMQPGFICVAGIELESRKHIRPVLGAGRITTAFLASNGGYFEIGHLLDLGRTDYKGEPPEVEDYRFDPGLVKFMGKVRPTLFWQMIKKASRTSFTEIFGPDLHLHRHGAAVEPGKGQASLGSLLLSHAPELYLNERDHLRLTVNDGTFTVDLSVTDLRLYEADHKTPKKAAIEQVAQWCKSGTTIILSVGLSRPWQYPKEDRPRHWLQVNNLYFENNPIWEF